MIAFQPMLNNLNEKEAASMQTPHEIPAAFRDLSRFVGELMNNTDDTNHSDSDGLPDSVELVIGTDPFNPDSDFDGLNDYDEAFMGMDPAKADSNDDRFPDYAEVTNVTFDLDGDGLPNAWDPDNDDDGVPDYLDTSPFAKTTLQSGFEIAVQSSGGPTYVSFQLRTNNPDHMRLIQQSWDWPTDSRGSFRDLDSSVEDVVIIPTLRIDCQNLPDQSEIEDYGIVVDDTSAYIPLFPVWEYGNMVALKGRMFFPETASSLSVSLDLSLMWRVSGLNDNEIRAFASESGDYLRLQADGSILANGGDIGANETFIWTSLGQDRGSLMASNGLYMTLNPDGSISASSDEITVDTEFVFNRDDDGSVVIVAGNGNNLTATSDGTLTADDAESEGSNMFTETDLGVVSSPMILATYYEDFTLTGLEVSENFGSSVGVFHGAELDELIAANLLLAYEYLRNSSNSLDDVPALLGDYNLTAIVSDVRSFSHQDLALQEAMSTMIPSAIESIAVGETLPVIVGVEDEAVCVELGQLSEAYILDGPLSVDLTGEPTIVSKVLRSSWYTGGDETPLELFEVIDEVRDWDLNESALITTVSLVSAWYCGEFAIASVGGVAVDHDYPEVVFLDETVEAIIEVTMMSIDIIFTAIEMLDTAYAFCEAFARLGTIAKTAGQSTWDMFKTTFNSIKQTLTSSTTVVQRISTALNVIGVILAVGISLYALFAIGEELGWGAVGTGIAVTYSVVMLAYSLTLLAIAAFGGPVGAVIALVIALVDTVLQLFGIDFMGLFIGWLIDCFTDTRTRSNVDLDYVDSEMSFVDVDGNGIDVGDNISYRSTLYGNVTITGDGSYSDLVDSYIVPHQVISVPWGSRSTLGGWTVENSTVYTSTSKSVLYETEAWVKPGIGMVNFPVAVGLYSDYRIYYDDCWWFFGWWCDRESQTNDPSDTQVSHWTTIYFDVMPGSIDEFGEWRGMVSSDSDGDGLNASEEASASTNPWKWDTDGDGLGDAYELTIGSDPTRYGRDTDFDGLDDRFEHVRGYNFSSADSDGDGLTDFFEYHGWAVNFTYRNDTYYWLVNSDPHLSDTDGDGIDDFEEYYCLLNPRSADTDGDGTQDEVTDYYLTHIDFSDSFAPGVDYSPNCVVVDEDGFVYTENYSNIVIYDQNGTEVGGFPTSDRATELECMSMNVSGERQTLLFACVSTNIFIYAVNGTLVGQIPGVDLVGIDVDIFGMTLDPDGPDPDTYYLYILASNDVVRKFVMNGTEMILEETFWGGYGTGPGQFDLVRDEADIDVDEDGYVYISDAGNDRIQKFESDGTFVTMWGERGSLDGFLARVRSMTVDANGDILTLDGGGDFAGRIQKWTSNGRWMCSVEEDYIAADGIAVDGENRIYLASWQNVTRCSHYMELVQAEPDYVFLDADSDGLTDVQEDSGWSITVTTEESTSSFTVSSEPMTPDTDADGIPDPDEFAMLSNPRSIDPDEDGLQDLDEWELGTNLTHWDTDGDGLGDGAEVEFGSDPKLQDTDGEGLSDYEEFLIGSDPNNNDTDQDGLDDLKELGFGSDPKNPDSDGDFMFDGQEYQLGTDPNSADTDSDGVDDGYEVLYDTNATSGDSDGDGLSDGFEISSLMSPLSNDTDGDGLSDSRELELGLNPKSTDSDGDGIPDSLDLDYLLELEGEIVLVYDDLGSCAGFVYNLSEHATVRVVDADTLQSNYSSARYIVLVGTPGSDAGGAGGLIHDLLEDSGDVVDRMTSSVYERMAVRYGLWNETQTIVMISQVYDTDWIRVLGILKSMQMTVSDGSVLVDYLNPRECFMLDQIDTMRTTDTFVWAKLSNMTTFSVEVEKLHDDEVEDSLSGSDALASGEVIMDKYVRIKFQSHDPNTSDTVSGSLIKIYYTAADLDMNGDGDGDDPEDLNESSLQMYLLSADGSWVRLSDVIDTTGVNTTDVEMFGMTYEGYLWANVSGLSLFGIAGLMDEGPGGPGIPWLLVLIAAAAAILLIAAVVVLRRRRAPPDQDVE